MQVSAGTFVARGEEQTGSTIPRPMFAVRLSTMNSFFPTEIPRDSMAVQQKLHTSKLQLDKFTTHSTFSCWKTKTQNPRKFLFRFSFGCVVLDQRSGDGRFIG